MTEQKAKAFAKSKEVQNNPNLDHVCLCSNLTDTER